MLPLPENSPKVDVAMSAPNSSTVTSTRKEGDNIEIRQTWTYFPHDSPRSQSALNNFVKNRVLPPLVERAMVAQYIRRLQVNSMMEGNYKEADFYFNLSKKYTQSCKASMIENATQFAIQKIDAEAQSVQELLDKINEEYDEKIRVVMEQKGKEVEALKQKHQEKIQNFIQKWEQEDALIEFTKPSVSLMILRDREKNMILTKNFEIAHDLKKQGDILEKEETMKAQVAAQAALQKERNEIEFENRKEMQELNNKINRKCIKIEKERASKVNPLLTRLKKLKTDKESGYFPEPKAEQTDVETECARNPMALTTPRTRAKFCRFRQQAIIKKLPMKGVKANFVAKEMPKSKIIIPKLAISR